LGTQVQVIYRTHEAWDLFPAQVREIAGHDSGSGGVVSTAVDIHHDYFVSPTAYIPVVVGPITLL